jgi:hypothetical protein
MKRRTFFRSIIGAVASLALSQKIGLGSLALQAPVALAINPAYESAEFEVQYIYHP